MSVSGSWLHNMWSAFSHFWAIRAEVAIIGIFEVTCLMDRATSSQSINTIHHQHCHIYIWEHVSGKVDRAGGLVFRLKDVDNYYLVRANPLEDNYNLYHVVRGSRREITGSRVKVTSGEWHEIRVEMKGNRITCLLTKTNS